MPSATMVNPFAQIFDMAPPPSLLKLRRRASYLCENAETKNLSAKTVVFYRLHAYYDETLGHHSTASGGLGYHSWF